MDEPGFTGRIRQKLVDVKRRWAREGRLLTGSVAEPSSARLPPGQREVKDWPVLDLGVRPNVSEDNWSLRVEGLVEAPVLWDWQAFRALPQASMVSDIHCVTAWSRYDNAWEGVAARHLIEAVRPRPEARFVVFYSYDGYSTNLPLKRFADPDVILAHSWQGRPLSFQHGGPVRVVVPKLYFWKSAKWLRRIVFRDSDAPGFWELRGYHNDGDPWKEERYG